MQNECNTIMIRSDDAFHAWLYPDKMDELPLPNFRKLMRIMFRAAWRNEEAIEQLRDWFTVVLAERKKLWDDRSLTFQREYQDPEQRQGRKTRADAKKHNDALYAEVKRAKARYDRVIKMQNIYTEEGRKWI